MPALILPRNDSAGVAPVLPALYTLNPSTALVPVPPPEQPSGTIVLPDIVKRAG
jgi:hypothetical protein